MKSDLEILQKQFADEAGFAFLSVELKSTNLSFEQIRELFKEISENEGGQGPVFYFQKSIDLKTPSETYLGFDSFEKLTVIGGRNYVENSGGRHEAEGHPFEFIAARLKKYKTGFRKDLPFFQGGALGYFSYESVRYLEPILENHPGTFRLAKKRKDFKDIEIIFFRKFILLDHLNEKIIFLAGCPNEGTNDSLHLENKAIALRREILDLRKIFEKVKKPRAKSENKNQKTTSEKETRPQDLISSLGKEQYKAGVQKLKKNIEAGDIFQAVLSDKFEFVVTAPPFKFFETLMTTTISAYQFYLYTGEKTFIGASPEMLLKLRQGELESHPIAGTRPRGRNATEEKKFEIQLKRSPKERAEHLMLVDLARNDLGRISKPGSVKVASSFEIKKFPGVMHLVSVVKGVIKEDVGSVKALGACFPAGTLSGAPKVRAMQLLSEIEAEPRGFYGGAVALLNFNGDLDSCISIRSMELNGRRGFFQAGAGVVADSNPEREYSEILQKTKNLRKVIATTQKTGLRK